MRTLEEQNTELLLELVDLRAESRLAQMHMLGRSAEMERLGDGEEAPQLNDFHLHASLG
ncbi:hypothetical protein AAFX91_23255 [Bradyrhizobium sp. 31Argb]|uniref:hypothetical protein n=1 Tax=unclassified Bradyrhizobium TaxID=2631580 RepID=UPI001FDEB786|nr:MULTISPECIES: hypothetical protein [unclassified Bradyrhizobium]MDI4232549.1 hypothetical protein [Bradyrhizobium sp. Arg237L]